MGEEKKAIKEFEKYRGLEKEICKKCQSMVKQTLTPVYRDLNSKSKFRQTLAKAKIVRLQATLWRKYCPSCVKLMRRRISQND